MHNDLRLVNTKNKVSGRGSLQVCASCDSELPKSGCKKTATRILDHNNNPMILVHFQSMWVILGRMCRKACTCAIWLTTGSLACTVYAGLPDVELSYL